MAEAKEYVAAVKQLRELRKQLDGVEKTIISGERALKRIARAAAADQRVAELEAKVDAANAKFTAKMLEINKHQNTIFAALTKQVLDTLRDSPEFKSLVREVSSGD